jgi:hypothetical protein
MNAYGNRGYQGNPEYHPHGMPEDDDEFDMQEEWHEEEFDENVSHASSRAAQTIVDSQRSTRLRNQLSNNQSNREVAPRASSPGIKRATNNDYRYNVGEAIQEGEEPYEEGDYLVVDHEVVFQEQEGDPEQKRDFDSAYDELVERMHMDQGDMPLLINEDEYAKAMHKKDLRKHLKERTDERVKHFQENKRRKMELIKQENENKELEECTFKPKLVTKPAGRRRKLDEFLHDQRKHEEDKAIKRNILLEQESQVEAGAIHHPEINESSRKMLQKRADAGKPVHERLYGISKAGKKINQILNDAESENMPYSDASSQRLPMKSKKAPRDAENETFAPKINEKSRGIVRDQPVQELLYNDALRRKDMNELKKQKIIQENSKKKAPINENNIEYLIHRFNKEFEPTFEAVAQQGEEGPSEILNYRQLGELLFDMGFLSGSASSESEERILLSSMWTGLGGAQNEGLHKEVIRAFLLAVEGVKITDSVKSPSEEEFGQMKDGEFYPDCPKISKHFKLMYLNRIRHNRDGAKRKKMRVESEIAQDLTFQPMLSENTQNLAQRYRQKIADNYDGGKITVLDILTAQTNKEQWIEETKKELAQKEQEECTFHPMTNENVVMKPDESMQSTGDKCFDLYTLAQAKNKQKMDKTRDEYEFEKNANECTFTPNINKETTRAENKPHLVNERSIQDNYERMRRAREEREFKKRMTERGYGEPAPQPKKQQRKQQPKRPTNYTRPQVMKKSAPATSVATAGSRPKREVAKKQQQDKPKQRRTQAMRSRLTEPTESSKRKQAQNQPKAEVRTFEHPTYEPQEVIDPEQMYRQIEAEREEIHDKIEHDEPYQDSYDGQPLDGYIESSPQEEQEQEMDQEQEMSGEGEYDQNYNQPEAEGEDGNPLLFVDVNLGPGRAERIVVYEGDTAEDLADEFTKKHGLDESLKGKLVSLLESQIAGLLGTINEGDEAASSGTEN